MGTYGINTEEFLDGPLIYDMSDEKGDMDNRLSFEKYLQAFEGDVCAETIAEAYNALSEKYEWHDKLQAFDKVEEYFEEELE